MKKDNTKKIAILNFITAALFYMTCIIYFLNKETTMGIIFLCLGTTYIFLGLANLKKKEENENKDKSKTKEG